MSENDSKNIKKCPDVVENEEIKCIWGEALNNDNCTGTKNVNIRFLFKDNISNCAIPICDDCYRKHLIMNALFDNNVDGETILNNTSEENENLLSQFGNVEDIILKTTP